jgi:hypothetical protein
MTPPRTQDPDDPKGLIREAFRIEGITYAECRSIFMDWALSLGPGQVPGGAIATLLARYAPDAPEHPMTAVLKEGLVAPGSPRRRGGWRGRRSDTETPPAPPAEGDPS